MFLLTLLLILNFTLSNDWLFDHRVTVGGLPISIIDALAIFGLLAVIAFRRHDEFEVDRRHPLLSWSIGLMVGGILCGTLGAMGSGAETRVLFTQGRDLSMLPIAIFLGYRALPYLRSANYMTYLWVFGSVASAGAVLFLVRETAVVEIGQGRSGFDELRSLKCGGDLGVSAAAFLAFAAVARRRVLPTTITVGLMLFCVAAACSLPHRGTYVLVAVTLTFAVLFVPRVSWGRRVTIVLVGSVLLAVTLLGGIAVMSNVTGRDFKSYLVEKRLKELIPGFEDETHTTVTATRLPGILLELKLWSEAPFTGKGIGYSSVADRMAEGFYSMNHNVWSSSLAMMGPLGLGGFWVPIFGTIVVGLRLYRANTHRQLANLGALCAIVAFMAFAWGSLSMSINQQRPAIIVGFACGLAFRARAMQLTLARQYEGYLEEGQSIDAYEAGAHGDPGAADPGGGNHLAQPAHW